MPLTKQQKADAVDTIQAKLDGVPTIYVTDYKGLSVEQVNDLRGRFREAGVEFQVVKNTLLKLAMDRLGGYDEIYEHLHGPTAVALSDEPAAPARVIKDFLKDLNTELPNLKAAYIDGAVFVGADQLEALAALKSKDELIGDILGLLMAPMTNIVGGLQAQGQNLVGALKTIAEKEA